MRVQAAIIGSGPLRQRFGWSNLKLQSLGKDEGSKGDHMVAPLASDAEIAAILGQIGWRPINLPVVWSKVSAAYAWGFSAAVSLLVIPVIIQSLVMPWTGVVGLLAVAGLIATRWLGWLRFGYALDGDRLLIRSGWWRRRLIILPLISIQSADYRENIVSRTFGTASLTLGVASGRGYSRHGIPAVDRERARNLRNRLLASYARTR